MKRIITLALPIALAATFFSACGNRDSDNSQQGTGALPVQVAIPFQRELQLNDIYTGRFEPIEEVNLRARVSGYVESVHFKEGEPVKKGDLMFLIDKRPFEAKVEAAHARVTQAEAGVILANAQLDRIGDLVQQGSVSAEEADLRQSNSASAEATLLAAKAELKTAELELEFTEVTAPISGIADQFYVTPGNFISGGTPGADLLTTIIPHSPIYCEFEIDERRILQFTRMYMEGEVGGRGGESPEIQIAVSDREEFEFSGKIDFASNRLNPNTATSKLRVLVENENEFLTPGLFGRVKMPIGKPFVATLVRDAALGFDQSKRFAWVLQEDNTVARRFVEVGALEGNFRVIESGLDLNEQIVVSGIQLLQNGMPVAPQAVNMDASITGDENDADTPNPEETEESQPATEGGE